MLIVTYHSIDDTGSPASTRLTQLESDVRKLKALGFALASLDDCAAWLEAGRSSSRDAPPTASPAIVMTFDDGYASVAREAAPLLERLGVPATVFVIAGRLGLDNQWPGQWRSIGAMPLVNETDVRRMAAGGMTIGCHSWSHPMLPGVDDSTLGHELVDAADRLEQITGQPVRHFAYPYGARGPREVARAAARYRTASNAHPAAVEARTPLHDLPRIDAHDLRLALACHVTHPALLAPYLALRRALRAVRRRAERSSR